MAAELAAYFAPSHLSAWLMLNTSIISESILDQNTHMRFSWIYLLSFVSTGVYFLDSE